MDLSFPSQKPKYNLVLNKKIAVSKATYKKDRIILKMQYLRALFLMKYLMFCFFFNLF